MSRHGDLTARIALLVLLTAELMDLLDQSVVLTALPAIQESTGEGTSALQWLTTGYSLPVAVGLITGGRLGDLYGRRRILLIGTFVFTAAALMCGLAAGPGVPKLRDSARQASLRGGADLPTGRRAGTRDIRGGADGELSA
ncbi:MFS transporter [Streptomyces sp. NPDC090054]|uniref:MFS transporter n=1 Tax=Streptomyces sp. NPDC090054 TaxID=3365933 RepID=UPI0038292B10